MDDTGTLGIATDCTLTRSEMSDIDAGVSAEVSLPAESERAPPLEDGPAPAFDGGAAQAVDDESAADAACDAAVDADTARTAQIIEAILFSSDAPLSAARLADLAGSCTPAAVRRQIEALNRKYEQMGLSFRIEAIARGYQMMTLADFRPWVAKLNKQRSETRLSAAALETLSIIAYKQPVIRADVEAIRGVACGEVISRLRDMGLIRVLGRAEVVGRPLLYGTTKKFLAVFGLVDLDDLPPMEALRVKSASRPVQEVEPVGPAPLPARPLEQCAAAAP
ncbi:MAG: SMC-Scp complex subunit ScpB [Phycisphaerae bacterium]